MPWSARFDDPIILPDGKKLVSLRDAIKHLGETVPKRERNHPRVVIAATVLTDAAEGRRLRDARADRGTADVEQKRRRPMTDDGLRGVAFHEAGHAVVALALGLPVARVEIFHEDNSGVTDIAGADGLPLVDHIALFVAGMNAEKMFDAPTHKSAGGGDRANVRELTQGHRYSPQPMSCAKKVISAHGIC